MPPIQKLIRAASPAVLALLTVLPFSVSTAADLEPVPVLHTETDDATEIAEGWFHRLYGFDTLQAYESQRGTDRTTFMVGRRWVDGQAQILIDILTPHPARRVAAIVQHNDDGADDIYAYVPILERVRRVAATELEKIMPAEVFPLGDLRPITFGEMEYSFLEDEVVSSEPCWVIEGRPLHNGLAYSRAVLAISKESGVALRTEWYRGRRVARRVRIDPKDVSVFGDHTVPTRFLIETPPSSGVTELTLANIMTDPSLPDRLFSHQNLKAQRFPRF